MNLIPNLPNLEDITRSFGFLPDPSIVNEVDWDDYKDVDRILSEENLFICRIPEVNLTDSTLKYEIIFYFKLDEDENKCFSMLRSKTFPEEDFQLILLTCVPLLEMNDKNVITEDILRTFAVGMKTNPSWDTIHLAVYSGIIEYLFTDCAQVLNKHSDDDGKCALHIAAENGSLDMIKKLIDLGADAAAMDNQSNTPLHCAAQQDLQVLEAFGKDIAKDLANLKNSDSETPLIIAMKADRSENVDYLIRANRTTIKEYAAHKMETAIEYVGKLKFPNLIDKHGGNLLHRVNDYMSTLNILELGFDINELNEEKQSPLHVMTIENNLDCVMLLLGRKCDPDIQDVYGNTALHYAAENVNQYTIMALLVFGAKINLVNNEGYTARHTISCKEPTSDEQGKIQDTIIYRLHYLGAERCRQVLTECQPGCAAKGQYNGNPPESTYLEKRGRCALDDTLTEHQTLSSIKHLTENHPNRIGRGRILCLDGGGIKGLSSTQILSAIEKAIGAPIYDSFDIIAGTSIGGILALMIAGGSTWKEAQHMLCDLKDRVFVGFRPYNSKNLALVIKDVFGENKKMSDLKEKKVILHATAADRSPTELHRFRNYDCPLDVLDLKHTKKFMHDPTPNLELWKAALATGSAPFYFRPFEGYLDGAFFANNPVLDVLTEIEELNTAFKIAGREDEIIHPTVVVSVGCAREQITELGNVDVSSNLIIATRNIIDIMKQNVSETDGPVADRGRAWCSMHNIPYFRFNPTSLTYPPLDETDAKILLTLMWESRSYMHTQEDKLEQLKSVLFPIESDN